MAWPLQLRRRGKRTRYLEHAAPPPSGCRPRVLLEIADGIDRWAYARAFRAAGYEVSTCGGPTPKLRCPLVDSHGCPLVDSASVVVTSADLGDLGAVVAAHGANGSPPLVIEAPGSRFAAMAERVPPGATVVTAPATVALMLRSVDAAAVVD